MSQSRWRVKIYVRYQTVCRANRERVVLFQVLRMLQAFKVLTSLAFLCCINMLYHYYHQASVPLWERATTPLLMARNTLSPATVATRSPRIQTEPSPSKSRTSNAGQAGWPALGRSKSSSMTTRRYSWCVAVRLLWTGSQSQPPNTTRHGALRSLDSSSSSLRILVWNCYGMEVWECFPSLFFWLLPVHYNFCQFQSEIFMTFSKPRAKKLDIKFYMYLKRNFRGDLLALYKLHFTNTIHYCLSCIFTFWQVNVYCWWLQSLFKACLTLQQVLFAEWITAIENELKKFEEISFSLGIYKRIQFSFIPLIS